MPSTMFGSGVHFTRLAPLERRRSALLTSGIRVVIVGGALVLGGCASSVDSQPAASSAFTPVAECTRNGGWWRDGLKFCEYH
jgi:hypothetical protein